MNLGQLTHLLRARYLIDPLPITQVRGQPFKAEQLAAALAHVVQHDSLPHHITKES